MENFGAFPLATINVAFNLPALYFVIAMALTIAVNLGLKKHREKQLDRTRQRLADIITEYFRSLDIEVSASCFSLFEGRRFVAVIESEPIKKFRHSFIIEQALVRHIEKTTGQQIEKIYWRFPFTPASDGQKQPAVQHPDMTDPYHADGPAQEWVNSGYQVEDTSWESYQKAVKHTHPDGADPE